MNRERNRRSPMLCECGLGWPARPCLLSRFDILGGVIHCFIVRIGILTCLCTEGHVCPAFRNPRARARSGVLHDAPSLRGPNSSTELTSFWDLILGLSKRVRLSSCSRSQTTPRSGYSFTFCLIGAFRFGTRPITVVMRIR
jgi:hypothetical protein